METGSVNVGLNAAVILNRGFAQQPYWMAG